MWSGNPNGSLVAEAGPLPPGRALDVGAGEGGDAIWLAERGWDVTASDISTRALHRITAEAARRGLTITTLAADANARTPFPPGQYELVSASYASIPRTPDDRGVTNILDAVAPGGVLVVISHDLKAMGETHQRRMFDPDAYLQAADFAARIEQTTGWTVELHETRPRPPGSATAAHHVDDVILRARRTA
jgi:SAM-dependent methyltransferase